jgi:hypothetical protein
VLLVTPAVVGLIGALHWKDSMFSWIVMSAVVRGTANADIETENLDEPSS